MKVFLLFRDRDFDLQEKLPPNEQALTQDLELKTLFNAMADGDEFLFDVARKAVFSGLKNDPGTILYRQDVLRDCLKNQRVLRDIYRIAVESMEIKKKQWYGWGLSNYPGSILYNAVEMLQHYMDKLRQLRGIADEHAEKFTSECFTALFAMLKRELSDAYLDNVRHHLKILQFRDGTLISAVLGRGNEGADYVLRKPHDTKQNWIQRIFSAKSPAYGFRIASRDENGFRALGELKDRGINLVANALAQSADHVLSFFDLLRTELAFYVGCLNLHDHLATIGEPVCFPLPVPSTERSHSFEGLYDVCLALTMKRKVVGNDAHADNKNLVLITGANQGGKSTFLRSIGLAQLMMQCGMFAPAKVFSSNICDRLFTHYKREEDVTMKSGKLDEELSRMNDIVDHLTPSSLVLFNESFAATNEREGSEIARQIVSALLENGIKIFFVTHLYPLAHGFLERKTDGAMFLRAERQDNGARTFKLIEGEPLETSFGKDLYDKIFGTELPPNEQAEDVDVQ